MLYYIEYKFNGVYPCINYIMNILLKLTIALKLNEQYFAHFTNRKF